MILGLVLHIMSIVGGCKDRHLQVILAVTLCVLMTERRERQRNKEM